MFRTREVNTVAHGPQQFARLYVSRAAVVDDCFLHRPQWLMHWTAADACFFIGVNTSLQKGLIVKVYHLNAHSASADSQGPGDLVNAVAEDQCLWTALS